MSWLLPVVSLPTGGSIRSEGKFDARAYQRAYYHAKRKPRRPVLSPVQKARKAEQRADAYHQNIDRERANARARYWRNRDKYAAASRERQRKYRERACTER